MPFNPLTISGCSLWLKGDAGCYKVANTTLCANGDVCAQWQDQSGNSHHGVQVASPVYVTGVSPSLLPVLNFNGSNGMSCGYSVAAPYTIFIVYLVHTTTGDHRAIQGSTNWLIGPRSGFHTHYAGGFVSGTGKAVTPDTFVRAYATNSGSASKIIFDGVDFTTAGGNVAAPGTIGLSNSGSTAESLEVAGSPGYIGEVLIYNSVLGSTDLTNVDTYLQRWQNAPASGGLIRPLALDGMGGAYMRDPLGA